MIVLTLLGYILLALYEFIPLYKQKFWRDVWANAIIGIISFSMAILLSLEVKIPSPAIPIEKLITSVLGK